jgi:hypothetical protein
MNARRLFAGSLARRSSLALSDGPEPTAKSGVNMGAALIPSRASENRLCILRGLN